MGVGCPWLPLVQPDASKPEAWRASASFVYGGNALSAAVAYGNLCVIESQIYCPGSSASQIYSHGADESEVYQPGAAAVQVGC